MNITLIKYNRASLRKQQGSMLLEGLIAILIFSMGILALMGLQAATIKASADAKYRADASFLANQIIGEIWADSANIAQYNFTGGTSSNATVNRWLNDIDSMLPVSPASQQRISIDAANRVTVTIRWRAPQDPGSNYHSHVAVAQLPAP